MYETIGDGHIEQLERLKNHLKTTNPNLTFKVTKEVWENNQVELDDSVIETHIHFEHPPSIIELLEFMGHRSLRDQVYMIANLLTISGFTQAEIAKILGISHKTYRNALLDIRKDFRGRDSSLR